MYKKSATGAGIFIIILGIIMIIAGVLFYKTSKDKIAKSEKTTAIINEIETERVRRSGKTRTEHRVYIDFEYDDEEYEHYKLGYYDASMREGDKIEIYVYERSGSSIEVLTEGGTNLLFIVFEIFGIVCVGIGTAVVIRNVKAKKNMEY